MYAGERTKWLILQGKRTRLTLEVIFWDSLQRIAQKADITVSELCNFVLLHKSEQCSLQSAIRIFSVSFWAHAATDYKIYNILQFAEPWSAISEHDLFEDANAPLHIIEWRNAIAQRKNKIATQEARKIDRMFQKVVKDLGISLETWTLPSGTQFHEKP